MLITTFTVYVIIYVVVTCKSEYSVFQKELVYETAVDSELTPATVDSTNFRFSQCLLVAYSDAN
jgi:hypothetical protein